MADTDTILADTRLQRADPKAPQVMPPAKALALDAIDEAYRERIKVIFDTFDDAWISGDITGGTERAAEGLKRIGAVRLRMRDMVNDLG